MNEKVTPEALVKALRCSASPIDGHYDNCKGCPYDMAEDPDEFFRELEEIVDGKIVLPNVQSDGMHHYCDVDRIALDAADMIEEFEKRMKF